jgi:hypothetical protein
MQVYGQSIGSPGNGSKEVGQRFSKRFFRTLRVETARIVSREVVIGRLGHSLASLVVSGDSNYVPVVILHHRRGTSSA